MNYSVDWSTDALSSLAAIWIGANDRKSITAAQATIDRALAQDPLGSGGTLSEGLYALQLARLRVLYEIDDTDNVVRVVSVKLLP